MEKKVQRLKLSWKIAGAVIVTTVLVGLLIGGFSLSRMENELLDTSRNHAMTVAQMAASFVDGDILESLQPGEEDTEDYQKTAEVLQSFLVGDDVSFIYTMRKNDAQVEFVVDADTEEGSAIGDTYESYDVLEQALAGNVTADSEYTTDEWGSFYTGYAPVYDSQGNVAGVVGVDCSVDSIEANVAAIQKKLVLIEVLCLLAAFVLATLVGKLVARNVQVINRKMDELASNDGDLTQEIVVKSGDEIESVAVSFNSFMEKLRDMMLSVKNNEERLEESTGQINQEVTEAADQIENISKTLNDMTLSMNDTSNAVTEIASAVMDAKNHADDLWNETKESAEQAQTTSKQADDAKKACQDSKKEMEQVIGNIAGEMQSKIEATGRISQIVQLTNDIIGIADQTHLLALNASIEAARAGDEGRGFAIVAEEIGKLADETAETAKKIEDINHFTVDTVSELVESAEEMIAFIRDKVSGDYESMAEIGSEYSADSQEFMNIMLHICELSQSMSDNMVMIESNVNQIMAVVEEETAGISMVSETAETINGKMNNVSEQSHVNEDIIGELGTVLQKFTV
jgi:methyl-accepting chemotaxis protein